MGIQWSTWRFGLAEKGKKKDCSYDTCPFLPLYICNGKRYCLQHAKLISYEHNIQYYLDGEVIGVKKDADEDM